MEDKTQVLSLEEIREILVAADDALEYALDHGQLLRKVYDPLGNAIECIERGLSSVKAAQSKNSSIASIRGHVANALARLRTALMSMQDKTGEEAHASPPERAVARAISLLFPISQTKGPLRLVPRKKRLLSRRKPPVSSLAQSEQLPRYRVTLHDVTNTSFFTGFGKDISSGGLFIATHDIHPVGTTLAVKVDLPGGLILTGKAEVSWIREHSDKLRDVSPGMGVVFHRLTPRATREINSYLVDHDSLFFEAV